MKKRYPLIAGLVIGILFSTLVFAIYEYSKVPHSVAQNEKTVDVIQPSSKQANAKIVEIENLINQRFLHDFDVNDLTEGMYAGMVDGLDDEYSYYFTKEEYQKAMESLSGHYQGIGIILVKGKDTSEITVGHVYEGAPAEKAGIKADDILLKVDGEELTGMLLEDVAAMIREGDSADVTLTLLREGEDTPLDINVTKGDIEVATVDSEMLEDNVGYIAIFQFTQSTAEQFETAYHRLLDEGMKRLVVDLRDNPGGSLPGVCDTLRVFMPEGLLVYSEDRQGQQVKFESEGKTPIRIPLAVIVNENSASASEIFAGAVKDHEVGSIVGVTTFGKGVVQSIFDLSDGSAVKLTTSQYFTPNGTDINGKGVVPNLKVEQLKPEDLGEDEEWHDVQLEKAIERVKGK